MTDRRPRALVTGISGQDGSFLAEQLLERGYRVTGLVRGDGAGRANLGSVEHLRDRLAVVRGDLTSPDSLRAAVAQADPDEIYHLASPTFVPDSWGAPGRTLQEIYGSTATLLAAVSEHSPGTRLFVAGSGEMFGDAPSSPHREDTPCRPRSPYGTAKLAAHQLVGQMRDRDGLFACSGILYNHESERRPERFVSRKITRAAAEVKLGRRRELYLGDLSAVRDWSFAGDMMEGAWLALGADAPADYVFASGVGHTVADLVRAAFDHVGLDPGRYLRTDPELVRAPETVAPIGDPRRAREQLGWRPRLSFEALIGRMVDADLVALGGAINAR